MKDLPATQFMLAALAKRVRKLELALEAAGIEIPESTTIPEGQSRIDDFVGC